MHILATTAFAAFGLATSLAVIGSAGAADMPRDLPPTVEEEASPSGSSGTFPEVGFADQVLKPWFHATCFDDPQGFGVIWVENKGNQIIHQGSKLAITIQPGNKTIIVTVPFDMMPYDEFALPRDVRPKVQRVLCSMKIVELAP